MPEQQHDPIEELSRFGAGLSTGPGGGEMPLSAADVRRRGDRIRRRRTALVTGAAALAVAAVTVPVLALSQGDAKRDDALVADDPALSVRDLLADADTELQVGRTGAFRTSETTQGDGQATVQVCQQQKLAALGASNSITRRYRYVPEVVAGETPPEVVGDGLVETVAQFASPDSARSAYDRFGAWLRDCPKPVPDATDARVIPARAAEVPDGSEAHIYDIQWKDASGEPTIGEVGLLLQDERIAIVAVTMYGASDYNYLPEDGGSPLDRMLPKAAERLRPGGTTAPAPAPSATVTDPVDAPAGTELPDDLPLADGWPEIDGDGSLEGPARDQEPFSFAPCGTDVPDAPEPADRITARWQEPEDFRGRQLSSYTSAAEARRAADAIVNAYRACPDGPRDDAGYVSHHTVADGDLGDESWVLGRSSTFDGAPAPGLDVTYVVRVGNTLLLITGAGEGGGSDPAGDILTTASAMADESTALLTSLCRFAGSTCAG